MRIWIFLKLVRKKFTKDCCTPTSSSRQLGNISVNVESVVARVVRVSHLDKKWEANTSQPTSTDNSLLLSQTKSLLEAGYSITLLPSAHVSPRLKLDSFTWDWTSSVAYSLLTAAWVEVESQPDPPTTLIPFLKSFELLWIGLVQVGLNNVDGLLGV